MEYYNNNIMDQMDLKSIDQLEALRKYKNGHEIYVSVACNVWMSFNIREDGVFPKFANGIEYFVQQDSDIIIVSRHKCIVDYFNSKGIYGKVLETARPNDVTGKVIYGTNLPLHIVSFAKEAYIINIQNTTGKEFDELTVEDIENCYHQVRKYVINSSPVAL